MAVPADSVTGTPTAAATSDAPNDTCVDTTGTTGTADVGAEIPASAPVDTTELGDRPASLLLVRGTADARAPPAVTTPDDTVTLAATIANDQATPTNFDRIVASRSYTLPGAP
jgi:hypothetical protein